MVISDDRKKDVFKSIAGLIETAIDKADTEARERERPDPYGITGLESACYNPLDEIDPGDIDMPDHLMVLSDGMIQSDSMEPFWTD